MGNADPDTHLQAVIETEAGYLAVGNTTSKGAPFFEDSVEASVTEEKADVNAAAVLFDKDGKIIWAKSFGGSAYDVLTGHSWSGSGYPLYFLMGTF